MISGAANSCSIAHQLHRLLSECTPSALTGLPGHSAIYHSAGVSRRFAQVPDVKPLIRRGKCFRTHAARAQLGATPLTDEMLTAGTEDAVPPQGLGVGSWHWDIVRGGFRWSEELRLIYGITADADLGVEALLNSVHLDDRAQARAVVRTTLSSRRRRHEHRFRIVRPDGEICHVPSRAVLSSRWQGLTGLAHRRRHRSWERHRSGYARGWQSVRCWRDS